MEDQDKAFVVFSRLQDLLAFAEEPPALSNKQSDGIENAFVLCMNDDGTAVDSGYAAASYALNHLLYCDGLVQPKRFFGQLFRLWFRLSSPRPGDSPECVQALGTACVSALSSFLSTTVPAVGAAADVAVTLSHSLHDAVMSCSSPAVIITLLDRFSSFVRTRCIAPPFLTPPAVSARSTLPTTA